MTREILYLLDLIKDEVKVAMKEFIEDHELDFVKPYSISDGARFLSRSQVAKYLGIGLSTVDYWSRIGKLNKLMIDGTVRFDKEEIDASITSLRKYRRINPISSPKTKLS